MSGHRRATARQTEAGPAAPAPGWPVGSAVSAAFTPGWGSVGVVAILRSAGRHTARASQGVVRVRARTHSHRSHGMTPRPRDGDGASPRAQTAYQSACAAAPAAGRESDPQFEGGFAIRTPMHARSPSKPALRRGPELCKANLPSERRCMRDRHQKAAAARAHVPAAATPPREGIDKKKPNPKKEKMNGKKARDVSGQNKRILDQ